MDIASLSMIMSDSKISQNVNISMMNKAIKQMEQTGGQIIEMMKASEVLAVPSGSSIDIKV